MTDSFQQADRQFAWNYLGSNKAKNEARSMILDLNKYQQSQSNQIDSAVDGLIVMGHPFEALETFLEAPDILPTSSMALCTLQYVFEPFKDSLEPSIPLRSLLETFDTQHSPSGLDPCHCTYSHSPPYHSVPLVYM